MLLLYVYYVMLLCEEQKLKNEERNKKTIWQSYVLQYQIISYPISYQYPDSYTMNFKSKDFWIGHRQSSFTWEVAWTWKEHSTEAEQQFNEKLTEMAEWA